METRDGTEGIGGGLYGPQMEVSSDYGDSCEKEVLGRSEQHISRASTRFIIQTWTLLRVRYYAGTTDTNWMALGKAELTKCPGTWR